MSDPSRLHADALVNMLRHRTSYDVYVGEVTAADDALTFPYLVLWPSAAHRPTVTLAGYAGNASTNTQITAVGRDVTECLAAADRASGALHRQRPAITGRNATPITQQAGGPDTPIRDDRARRDGRPVFFLPLFFAFSSTPQE